MAEVVPPLPNEQYDTSQSYHLTNVKIRSATFSSIKDQLRVCVVITIGNVCSTINSVTRELKLPPKQ